MPSNYFIEAIHHKNKAMLSREQALNIFYLLKEVIHNEIEGDIVELGCYKGLTAVLIQKTLDLLNSSKQLHLYDSFQGLGRKEPEDLVDSNIGMRKCDFIDNRKINKGWFQASLEEVKQNFFAFKVREPQIYPGWFSQTIPHYLPSKIAFAHIDVDFYRSTLEALEAVYPRLMPKACLIIDDYCDPLIHKKQNTLPGVKKACDVFFKDKPEKPEVLLGGLYYHAKIEKQ